VSVNRDVASDPPQIISKVLKPCDPLGLTIFSITSGHVPFLFALDHFSFPNLTRAEAKFDYKFFPR